MTPSEIDKMIKDAGGVVSLTASSVALERILELEAEVERLQEEVEKGINHALELRSEMGKRDAEITRLQAIVELHYLKRYRL